MKRFAAAFVALVIAAGSAGAEDVILRYYGLESNTVATRDQGAWLAENLPTSEEEKQELIFSVSHVLEQDTYATTIKNGRLHVVGFGSDTLLIVSLQERERFLALVSAVEVDDDL